MTTANEDTQRIRNYLVTQANKLSVAELVEKVRRDSFPLREVAASIPPERFAESPAPNDWSAAQVYTHILAMTEHGVRTIQAIIEQGAPPARVADTISRATRPNLRTADDYWHAYSSQREPFYAQVSQAKGDEHLDVKITYPPFGDLNWREWLLFMRVHDLDHIRQLQSIAEHFRTHGGAI